MVAILGGTHARTSITGVEVGVDVTRAEKIWNILTAMGNMAFAYAFSMVLIEIQDTLKPNPPENIVMKKAISLGIWVTTFFYLLCGIMGYAAFGNNAPGNFLTGFGFFEPFWLVAIGNIFIVVHLVGAFQKSYISHAIA
ncbi:Amino acid permease 6 [Bienertia sinuspersici]